MTTFLVLMLSILRMCITIMLVCAVFALALVSLTFNTISVHLTILSLKKVNEWAEQTNETDETPQINPPQINIVKVVIHVVDMLEM